MQMRSASPALRRRTPFRRGPAIASVAILGGLCGALAAAIAVNEPRGAEAAGRLGRACIVAAIEDGRFPDRPLEAQEAALRRRCGIPTGRAVSTARR